MNTASTIRSRSLAAKFAVLRGIFSAPAVPTPDAFPPPAATRHRSKRRLLARATLFAAAAALAAPSTATAVTTIAGGVTWEESGVNLADKDPADHKVVITAGGSVLLTATATRAIWVANSNPGGFGTLVLRNGGSLKNNNTGTSTTSRILSLNLTSANNSVGKLIIGSDIAGEFAPAGTIDSTNGGQITVNATGTGVDAQIWFNHSNPEYYFTKDGTATRQNILITGGVGITHDAPGTTYIGINGNTTAFTYTGDTVVNAGTLSIRGPKSGAGGAVTVASGATFLLSGAWTNSAAITNSGTITLSSTIAGSGITTNSVGGVIKVTGEWSRTGAIDNSGTITLSSTLTGTTQRDITNSGVFSVAGAATNTGTITNSGALSFASTLNTAASTIVNNAGATLKVGGAWTTNGGSITNSGIINMVTKAGTAVTTNNAGATINSTTTAATASWVGDISNEGTLNFKRGGGSVFGAGVTISGHGDVFFERTSNGETLSINGIIDGARNVKATLRRANTNSGTIAFPSGATFAVRNVTNLEYDTGGATVNIYGTIDEVDNININSTYIVNFGSTAGAQAGAIVSHVGNLHLLARTANFYRAISDVDVFNVNVSGILTFGSTSRTSRIGNLFVSAATANMNGYFTDIENFTLNVPSGRTATFSVDSRFVYTDLQAADTTLKKTGTGTLSMRTIYVPQGHVDIVAGMFSHYTRGTSSFTSNASYNIHTGAQLRLDWRRGATLNGLITGGGLLYVETRGGTNNWLSLTMNNDYSGGTVIRASDVYLRDSTTVPGAYGEIGTGPVTFTRLFNSDSPYAPTLVFDYGASSHTITNSFDGVRATAGNIIKLGTGTVTLTGAIGGKLPIRDVASWGGELVIGTGGSPPTWAVQHPVRNVAGTSVLATLRNGGAIVFDHNGLLFPYTVRANSQAGWAGKRSNYTGAGNLVNRGTGTTVLMAYQNQRDTFTGVLRAEHGTFQIGMGGDTGRVGPTDTSNTNSGSFAEFDIWADATISLWRKTDLYGTADNNARIQNKITSTDLNGAGTFLKKGGNFVILTNEGTDFRGTYLVEAGGLAFGASTTANVRGFIVSSATFDLRRTFVPISRRTTVEDDRTAVLVLGRGGSASRAITLYGEITGVGALAKVGAGILYLTQDNTYSGGTHIRETGTLYLGNSNGTLDTGTLGTGTVLFTNSTAKLTINRNDKSDGDRLEIHGNIKGGLVSTSTTLLGDTANSRILHMGGSTGTATTVLFGKNNFKGYLDIASGTVVIAGDSREMRGANDRIKLTANTDATLQIGDGGTGGLIYQTTVADPLGNVPNTSATTNTRLIFNDATIEINHADDFTWSRPLVGTTGALTGGNSTNAGLLTYSTHMIYNQSNAGSIFLQAGSGTTALTADNSAYRGTIRIEGGRLSIGADNNVGLQTSSQNIIDGGTLLLGAGTYSASKWLLVANADNGIAVATGTATFNGILSDFPDPDPSSKADFTKLGDGTLAFVSGTYSYEGDTRIREGTLDISGLPAITLAPPFLHTFTDTRQIILEGGALQIGNNVDSDLARVVINIPDRGVNAITVASGETSSLRDFNIEGYGDFEKKGLGRLVFTGTNSTYYGSVTISAGTLQLGGAFHGTLGVDNSVVHHLKNGTLVLAGNYDHQDNWSIEGNPADNRFITPSINTNFTGRLSGNASLVIADGGSLTLTNQSNSFNGGIIIADTSRVVVTGSLGVNWNYEGRIRTGDGQFVFATPSGKVQTFSGPVDGTASSSIVKEGDGALYVNSTIPVSFTVNKGINKGTIGGEGTLTNINTIAPGVTIDPGSAPNKVGPLTLQSLGYTMGLDGIIFHVDFGTGTRYDQIVVTGSAQTVFTGITSVDMSTVEESEYKSTQPRAILTTTPTGGVDTIAGTFSDTAKFTFKGVDIQKGNPALSHLTATIAADHTVHNIELITDYQGGVPEVHPIWNGNVNLVPGQNGFKHGDSVKLSGGNASAVATGGAIVGELEVEAGNYTFTGGPIVGGHFNGSSGDLIIASNAGAIFQTDVNFAQIVVNANATVRFDRNATATDKILISGGGEAILFGEFAHGQKIQLEPSNNDMQDGILTFDRNSEYDFTGSIAGQGTVRHKGHQTLTLSGDNPYSGTLSAEGTSATIRVTGSLGDASGFDGLLSIAAGNSIVFDLDVGRTQRIGLGGSNILSDGTTGTGILTKLGEGTLVLDGTSSDFTGTIAIRGGVLSLAGDAGKTSINKIYNATLGFEANSEPYTSNWELVTARSTLSVDAGSATFAGELTGLNLVKAGAGELILAGVNKYTGNTHVEAGRLFLATALNDAPLGDFNLYTKDVYISSGAELHLGNKYVPPPPTNPETPVPPTKDDYQRFTGTFHGAGTLIINAEEKTNIYDFYGKVETPTVARKGTIGGKDGVFLNLQFNPISRGSVVISPGNNVPYDDAGVPTRYSIGSLTIGTVGQATNLHNVSLLVDIGGGSTSDKLLVTGNAIWNAETTIVDIRTASNAQGTWESGDYVIARVNQGEFSLANGTPIDETEIYFNGTPLDNTRLEGEVIFMDELTDTKIAGSTTEARTAQGAYYGLENKSAIVLKAQSGESQVLYWQGKDPLNGDTQTWVQFGPANWKWNREAGLRDRVISFWDGDAVIFADRDGGAFAPKVSEPVGADRNIVVTNGGVLVASMTVMNENERYTFSGGKITGTRDASLGTSIEEVDETTEQFKWLTAELTFKPRAIATFNNKLEFAAIDLQGPTTGAAVDNPATGSHAIFNEEVIITTEALTIGRNSSATFNGPTGWWAGTRDSTITIGTYGKVAFNPTTDKTWAGTISDRVADYTPYGSGEEAVFVPNSYDAGNLEKGGAGKLTLVGDHSYSGTTTVNEGVLEIVGHLGVHETPYSELISATPDNTFLPHLNSPVKIAEGATLTFAPHVEQIVNGGQIGGLTSTEGGGTVTKEGAGILNVYGTIRRPASKGGLGVAFIHKEGVLSGTGWIEDISFQASVNPPVGYEAIISPGLRAFYSVPPGDDSEADEVLYTRNSSGSYVVYNEDVMRFGEITFGYAGGTTVFDNILYAIDIELKDEVLDVPYFGNSDRIRVVGNAEFGKNIPNTIDLSDVSLLDNAYYTILTADSPVDIDEEQLRLTKFRYSPSVLSTRQRAYLRINPDTTNPNRLNELQLVTLNKANLGLTWEGWKRATTGSLAQSWNAAIDNENWRFRGEDNTAIPLYFMDADAVIFPADLPEVLAGGGAGTVAQAKRVKIEGDHAVAAMTVEGQGYIFTGDKIYTSTAATENIFPTEKLIITNGGEVKFENAGITFKEMEVQAGGTASFLAPYSGVGGGNTSFLRNVLQITGSGDSINVAGTLVLGWGPSRTPFVENVIAVPPDPANGILEVEAVPSNYDIKLSGNGVVDFRGGGTNALSPMPYLGTISGSGGDGEGTNPYALTKSGGGAILLTLPQTYTGGTKVVDASSNLIVGATLGAREEVNLSPDPNYVHYNYAGKMNVEAGATLTFAGGAGVNQTLSGNAIGAGTILKDGAGQLNVNGTIGTAFRLENGILAGAGGVFEKGIDFPTTIGGGKSITISPGARGAGQRGTLYFGTDTTPAHLVFPAGLKFAIDLPQTGQSDQLDVKGSVVFSSTDTGAYSFDLNPGTGTWKDGYYTIIKTTEGVTYAGAASAVLTLDGVPINPANFPRARARVFVKDFDLILQTWEQSLGTVWWGTEVGDTTHGNIAGNDNWNQTKENWKEIDPDRDIDLPPPPDTKGDIISFNDGDHALFFNNGAPQNVKIVTDVTVGAMTIGSGSFVFSDVGKITGDAESANWGEDATGLPYIGVEGGLHVEAGASARFENTGGVEYLGGILIDGTANFSTNVDTPTLTISTYDTNDPGIVTVGNSGHIEGSHMEEIAAVLTPVQNVISIVNAGNMLIFDRTATNDSYSGDIIGNGILRKTGEKKMTLSGADSRSVASTTQVYDGILEYTGSLGPKTSADTDPTVVHTYRGVIQIGNPSTSTLPAVLERTTLAFNQTGFTQIITNDRDYPDQNNKDLVGVLRGLPTTKLHVGFDPLESTNRPATKLIIDDHYSPLQSDITVGSAANLKITGRIGVWGDTWDKDTNMERTYWHANYGGKINIEAGGVLDFAAVQDFQTVHGNLTGGGTLIKSSQFPFYFMGDASTFTGNTQVSAGNFFLDTRQTIYGAAGNTGTFSVASNAALYVELFRANEIPLTLNAGSFVMQNNSGLVLRGGGRLIVVTPADSNTVSFASGATLNMYIGLDSLVDGRALRADWGELNGDVASGVIGGALPDAKLSFRSAANVNVARENTGQVVAPSQMHLTLDYQPTPTLRLFTLIEGVAFNASVSWAGGDILAYLGLTDYADTDTSDLDDFKIGNSRFQVFIQGPSGNERLMLLQLDYAPSVPEPGTYAIWGTGLLLGLAVLRRRRKKKADAAAAAVAAAGVAGATAK